jgi:hypothetical protein
VVTWFSLSEDLLNNAEDVRIPPWTMSGITTLRTAIDFASIMGRENGSLALPTDGCIQVASKVLKPQQNWGSCSPPGFNHIFASSRRNVIAEVGLKQSALRGILAIIPIRSETPPLPKGGVMLPRVPYR